MNEQQTTSTSTPANPDPATTPRPTTTAEFAANLASVKARIAAACERVGRDPGEVELLPVSKTVPPEHLRLAYQAGMRKLGENKVQEAREKSSELADLEDLQWAVIGHLQSNKAKYVARFASEFHALDRLKVAQELDRRLQREGRGLDVYVQVNSSGEQSKFGLAPEDVLGLVRELPNYGALRVRGLMTLALFSSDLERVRRCFVIMRELRERLRQDAPDGLSFDGLSMGMSGDFEVAIEEGATVVRVGQSIFGTRPLPDSHYWPGATSGAGKSGGR